MATPVWPDVATANTRQIHRALDPTASSADVAKTMQHATDAIERAILTLLAARGPDKTICPSEAARAVAGDHQDNWGPLMQPVRRIAVSLAKEGRIVITRKGRIVDPDDFRGIYRLGLPRED